MEEAVDRASADEVHTCSVPNTASPEDLTISDRLVALSSPSSSQASVVVADTLPWTWDIVDVSRTDSSDQSSKTADLEDNLLSTWSTVDDHSNESDPRA